MTTRWGARPAGAGHLRLSQHVEARARGPVYARWRGIIARAENIHLDGRRLILIVESSSDLKDGTTRHDLTYAAITAVAFKHYLPYRRPGIVEIHLRDSRGFMLKLVPDTDRIEQRILAWTESARAMKMRSTLIPAPLVAFLIDRSHLSGNV